MRFKKKILSLLQLPPPIHGHAVMNEIFATNPLLGDAFAITVIPMRFAKDFSDLGKLQFRKFMRLIQIVMTVLFAYLRSKPDMIYFTLTPHGKNFYRDLLFVLFFKQFRVPLILHLHGKGVREGCQKKWKRWLYRWVFRHSFVIHHSPLLYEDVAPVVLPERVRYVPLGIPNVVSGEDFLGLMESRKKEVFPKILFMSSMTESKGPLTLVDALSRLKASGYTFQALFAGVAADHSFLGHFHQRVRQHHLENEVHYVGFADAEKKREWLCRANIFVHPTWLDSFGLVLLEAMQFGLPVIASHEGAIPDIVTDEGTGFLFPKKDTAALTRHLETLIKDPALRLEMGGRGRQRFLDLYTENHFAKRLQSALDEIPLN